MNANVALLTEPTRRQADCPTLPIAVVITAHGLARLLPQAIASVRAQTAAPAEAIVVDDTFPGVESMQAARAAGAKVVRHPLGPNWGRNVAILETRQPWIAFLDTDDAWVPHKLERQWQAVQSVPDLGALFSNFWEVSEDEHFTRPFLEQRAQYWAVKRHEVAPGVQRCERESLVHQFLEGNFFGRSTLLIRREHLVQVGLFNRDLVHLEDRDCWLRLLSVAQMAVLEEPLMWSHIDDSQDPDRSRWGYETAVDAVRLTELVLAHPREYPPEVTERYRAGRWRLSLAVGRLAEEQHHSDEARRYYARAWWLGGGPWPLALAGLCYLPDSVRRALRALRGRLRRA